MSYKCISKATPLLLAYSLFLIGCGGGEEATTSTDNTTTNNDTPPVVGTPVVNNPTGPSITDNYTALRTFYVDYENGDDYLEGTSAATAWKHAPGDPDAQGIADQTLQPGDMVLFNANVTYRGVIRVNTNGSEANPIIYKGNGWGTGKAIIDGSEPLVNWTQCSSAADCGGNSNWANIYYATAPSGTTALTSNLYQDNNMLYVSQHPNPPDPFFMDNHSSYQTVSGLTSTTATDPWFASSGGSELVGSYAFVWRSVNEVDFRKITAFNATENRITFNALGAAPYSQTSRYKVAIANNLNDTILDRAGEYYFDENTRRVYLWPVGSINPNTANITISVRGTSFNLGSNSHIVIDGFRIQKGIGTAISNNLTGESGIVVSNNEIVNWRSDNFTNLISIRGVNSALIANNYLGQNARLRGIVVSGDNISISNNNMVKLGRTPIAYFGGSHGEIVGNNISDSTGVHSNGISVYLGATDILVARNTVFNSNIPLTVQDVSNLKIINNIFHGDNSQPVMACWTGSSSNLSIKHNLLLASGSWGGGFYNQQGTINGLVIKNNIIDGMDVMAGDISHNIYTRSRSSLSTGETVVTNLDTLFVDPANHDYHLLSTSPARDAGTEANVAEDFDQNSRPSGAAPDIGAYEYIP